MRNHVQRGDTLPIIAPFDVTSGRVLQVDGIVGVVNAHAMAGTECEITRYGVFELPKAAGEVWSTGDRVYYTEGDAFLRLAGGALVGCAVQDAGSEDVLAYVLLDGAVRDSSPIALIVVPDSPVVGEVFTVIANLQDGVTLSSITATAGGTPIALTGSGNTRTGTAPAEAGPLVVTATGADAEGNPLTAARTVQVREEPVAPTAPGQFGASDWDVTTGPAAGEIVLNITALPSNGGSPFTAFEQTVDGGSTWTALSGTGAGSRTLTMPAAGTAYTFAIRAVNAVGAGAASASKSATSGAAPAEAITMSQLPVSRIYQRATDTGGDFGHGAGVIPIEVTASAATPVYARLRDAVTGDVIKSAWQVGNVTEGASTLDVAGIPARRGRCYVDLAAKAEGPWQEGTTPVAMGAIIAGGGQSQMGYTAYANGAGTLASLGITVPDDGFISWHARDSADAQDWTDGTWGRPADDGQYTGSFAGQILQDMTAALGVAVGYVGYSRGTTKASDFAAGTADRNRLHAQLDMAGGFEAFLWVQGGTDMSSSTPPATFKAATKDVLDSLPAHNAIRGSNFRLIGSATFTRTSSTTVNSNNMRRAVQELMTQLGGTYMDTRDIILTDGIHQSQAGGQRFARHVRRALLQDWHPPIPVSATKAGAVITVACDLSDGATLALTGVPTNKVRVEQAGTALTIASVAASGSNLTITLSADPGDVDLDVWIYPSPDPSNAAATAIIADNSAPVGRPAQPNYNALIAQAGGGSSLAVEG
ncbi:DUF2190 family protein, partial [Sinirhodobacter populi]